MTVRLVLHTTGTLRIPTRNVSWIVLGYSLGIQAGNVPKEEKSRAVTNKTITCIHYVHESIPELPETPLMFSSPRLLRTAVAKARLSYWMRPDLKPCATCNVWWTRCWQFCLTAGGRAVMAWCSTTLCPALGSSSCSQSSKWHAKPCLMLWMHRRHSPQQIPQLEMQTVRTIIMC